MRRPSAVIVLAVALSACLRYDGSIPPPPPNVDAPVTAPPSDPFDGPPTTVPSEPGDRGTPTSADTPAPPADPVGVATVELDDGTILGFDLSRCGVGVDALVIDGASEKASLAIRHASPPTHQPPEPSLSDFRVYGPDIELTGAPGGIIFDDYQPATHTAGRAVVWNAVDRQFEVGFEVSCLE